MKYNIIKELDKEKVMARVLYSFEGEDFVASDLADLLETKDGANISVFLGQLVKDGSITALGYTSIKDRSGNMQKKRVYRAS